MSGMSNDKHNAAVTI